MAIKRNSGRLRLDEDTSFPIAEAYRTARTNIMFALSAGKHKTVVFSSACSKEGKTSTCTNLALAIANTGASVLLIDADLRKPSIHRTFKTPNKLGLSNVLAEFCSFEEAVCRNISPNLDLLLAGPVPPNPAELLGTDTCGRLLSEQSLSYDYIFVDTSPINLVTDPVVVATKADGIVIIAMQNESTHDELSKAISALEYADIHIYGIILTGVASQQKYGRHPQSSPYKRRRL